jgi:hypothetical protein
VRPREAVQFAISGTFRGSSRWLRRIAEVAHREHMWHERAVLEALAVEREREEYETMRSKAADLITAALAPLGWRRDPSIAGWRHEATGWTAEMSGVGKLRLEEPSGKPHVIGSRKKDLAEAARELAVKVAAVMAITDPAPLQAGNNEI